MIRSSLTPAQNQLLHLIEELAFGRIEQLSIHNGEPCYDPAPHIVQEIKLGSETERRPDQSNPDLTLKKEFLELFSALARLNDGVVVIEVRHGAPFRIIIERRYTEFLP